MRCNIIAQRVALQEHLLKISDEIFKFLDDIANNDEDAKQLNFDNISMSTFNVWLQGFKIENPSDYFKD